MSSTVVSSNATHGELRVPEKPHKCKTGSPKTKSKNDGQSKINSWLNIRLYTGHGAFFDIKPDDDLLSHTIIQKTAILNFFSGYINSLCFSHYQNEKEKADISFTNSIHFLVELLLSKAIDQFTPEMMKKNNLLGFLQQHMFSVSCSPQEILKRLLPEMSFPKATSETCACGFGTPAEFNRACPKTHQKSEDSVSSCTCSSACCIICYTVCYIRDNIRNLFATVTSIKSKSTTVQTSTSESNTARKPVHFELCAKDMQSLSTKFCYFKCTKCSGSICFSGLIESDNYHSVSASFIEAYFSRKNPLSFAVGSTQVSPSGFDIHSMLTASPLESEQSKRKIEQLEKQIQEQSHAMLRYQLELKSKEKEVSLLNKQVTMLERNAEQIQNYTEEIKNMGDRCNQQTSRIMTFIESKSQTEVKFVEVLEKVLDDPRPSKRTSEVAFISDNNNQNAISSIAKRIPKKMKKRIETYDDSEDVKKGRHCLYCDHQGHNRRSCDLIKIYQDLTHINEEEDMPLYNYIEEVVKYSHQDAKALVLETVNTDEYKKKYYEIFTSKGIVPNQLKNERTKKKSKSKTTSNITSNTPVVPVPPPLNEGNFMLEVEETIEQGSSNPFIYSDQFRNLNPLIGEDM